MKNVWKLIAIVSQLAVLVHVSGKFGVEAGLFTLAAIFLNVLQLALSD